MATPTSSGVERVCETCGRVAAPHEYFCHRCTTRLPDPASYVAAGRAARTPPPRGDVVGWPVLLTVVAVVLVVGGVIAAAVVGFIRLDPFAPDPDRPGEVVRQYVAAVQDDDCTAAIALETDDFRSRARCEANVEVLDGTDRGDLRVEDELVLGDDASVKLRVTIDDVAFERCTYDLRLDDVWLIEDSVCEAPTRKP